MGRLLQALSVMERKRKRSSLVWVLSGLTALAVVFFLLRVRTEHESLTKVLSSDSEEDVGPLGGREARLAPAGYGERRPLGEAGAMESQDRRSTVAITGVRAYDQVLIEHSQVTTFNRGGDVIHVSTNGRHEVDLRFGDTVEVTASGYFPARPSSLAASYIEVELEPQHGYFGQVISSDDMAACTTLASFSFARRGLPIRHEIRPHEEVRASPQARWNALPLYEGESFVGAGGYFYIPQPQGLAFEHCILAGVSTPDGAGWVHAKAPIPRFLPAVSVEKIPATTVRILHAPGDELGELPSIRAAAILDVCPDGHRIGLHMEPTGVQGEFAVRLPVECLLEVESEDPRIRLMLVSGAETTSRSGRAVSLRPTASTLVLAVDSSIELGGRAVLMKGEFTAPASGARMRIRGTGEPIRGAQLGQSRTATTDAFGRFHFSESSPADEYLVSVEHPLAGRISVNVGLADLRDGSFVVRLPVGVQTELVRLCLEGPAVDSASSVEVYIPVPQTAPAFFRKRPAASVSKGDDFYLLVPAEDLPGSVVVILNAAGEILGLGGPLTPASMSSPTVISVLPPTNVVVYCSGLHAGGRDGVQAELLVGPEAVPLLLKVATVPDWGRETSAVSVPLPSDLRVRLGLVTLTSSAWIASSSPVEVVPGEDVEVSLHASRTTFVGGHIVPQPESGRGYTVGLYSKEGVTIFCAVSSDGAFRCTGVPYGEYSLYLFEYGSEVPVAIIDNLIVTAAVPDLAIDVR